MISADRANAVIADAGVDAGVPAHYGNPYGEQVALAAGVAVTDRSNLGVVTVSGPDRLSWLTTLSTQKLTDLPPAGSAQALLLDPQGHVLFDLMIVDDGESAWLIVEGVCAKALVSFLEKMRFMLRVEVADRSEEVAVIGWLRPRQIEENTSAYPPAEDKIVAAQARAIWYDPWPVRSPNGASYYQGEHHPGSERQRVLAILPRDDYRSVGAQILSQMIQLLPVTSADGQIVRQVCWAGTLAWEALRIEDWQPRFAFEVDSRTLAPELDLLRTAVHLNKGCYCGQESIARIVNLGRPPRRLVFLDLDGSQAVLPHPGAEISSQGRLLGKVTSVARHAELGPIALGLVKRGYVGTQVEVAVAEGPGSGSGDKRHLVSADGSTGPSDGQRSNTGGKADGNSNIGSGANGATTITAHITDIVTPTGKCDCSPTQRPGGNLRTGLLRR